MLDVRWEQERQAWVARHEAEDRAILEARIRELKDRDEGACDAR